MPEDQEAINALADEFDNEDFAVQLPYDNDPVAQRIAGRLMGEVFKVWDISGHRSIYDGWCSEEEARLLVLSFGGNLGYACALRNIEQLSQFAADYIKGPDWGHYCCDTRVTRTCSGISAKPNEDYPVEFLAVKRGEYICAFIACVPCMEHIKTGAGFDENYVGPAEDWIDNRQAAAQLTIKSPEDDPFAGEDDV
jgi:hypothetical protein